MKKVPNPIHLIYIYGKRRNRIRKLIRLSVFLVNIFTIESVECVGILNSTLPFPLSLSSSVNCLCVCFFVSLFVCQSVYLSPCLLLCPSVCLCVSVLCVCLSFLIIVLHSITSSPFISLPFSLHFPKYSYGSLYLSTCICTILSIPH